MKQIPAEVISILDSAVVEGNILRLTCGQLDRKTYLAVNKVLEALGGKWDRKAKGHIFSSDPAPIIEEALLTGTYSDRKKDFNLFETPPELANRLVDAAGIESGETALEPSAGRGAIALKLAERVGKENVWCYEILEDCVGHLKALGFTRVFNKDFLTVEPERKFKRIVMNPPFAKQADIDHVTHAWKFLESGGRLVSVMSAGIIFRKNRKTKMFRELLERHHGYVEELEEGAFKKSGTMVKAVIVFLEKWPL